MTQPLGMIQQPIRYPVKPFRGEQLLNVQFAPHGLYGDRSLYFRFDEEQQKYVTIQVSTRLATLHDPSTPNELPRATPGGFKLGDRDVLLP